MVFLICLRPTASVDGQHKRPTKIADHSRRMRGNLTCLILLAVVAPAISGCATVLTPIPPSQYPDLGGNHTYRVTTKDGTYRDTSVIEVEDSALVIVKPRAAMHDPRPYPLRIEFSNIQSVATIGQENITYVESGYEWGKSYGAEAQYYSSSFFIVEMGYVTGERVKPEKPRVGFGGTAYFAMSSQDFRAAIKPRIRYRFNHHISLDLSAGPYLDSWTDELSNGFVGTVGLNLGSYVSFRSEWTETEVEPWRDTDDGVNYVDYPGGRQKVWYNGVALRGGPGWATAGIGTAALIMLTLAMFSALASSN